MQNFETVRGNSFDLNLTFQESSEAVDITDWDITLRIKRHKDIEDDDAEAIAAGDLLIVNATITDAESGEATCNLTAEQTEDLRGSFFYSVKYDDGDATIKTAMQGVLTFTEAA